MRWLMFLLFLTPGFSAVAEEETGATRLLEEDSPSTTATVLEKTETASKAFLEGKLDEAKSGFESVLALDPDNVTALVNLGAVGFRMEDYDAAELHLNRAVRLNPDAGAAWLTLGVLYLETERLDDALAALTRAVVLEPKNWRAHNYLGVTVGRKGWLYGAAEELGKAIALNPKAAEPNFNLALIHLQRRPPTIELARRHYREALRLGAVPDPLIEKQLEESP